MRLILGMWMVVLCAGCATTSYDRAIKTGEALRASRPKVVAARQQVDDTIALLEEMVTAPQNDLRPLYERLEREVKTIEIASERSSERVNAFRQSAYDFLWAWAAELETIDDEEIVAVKTRHRDQARENIDEFEKKATAVRAAYWPLLEDLQGIRQHLGQDLTADGVAAIQPKFTQASENAQSLRELIEESIAELDRIADLLDPPAP